MRMRLRVSIVFFILALLSITAFSATSKGDPEKEALVFGCIDMSAANSYLYSLSFLRYPPKVKISLGIPNDIKMFGIYENGLFIGDRVKPGQYWLMAFHAKEYGVKIRDEITYCQVNYNPTEEDTFTVQAGDLYYFGTYKYIEVKKGTSLSKGEFILEKAETPSEKELLEVVLEKLKGSKWEEKIRERLAAL